jgi:hypothetical protein
VENKTLNTKHNLKKKETPSPTRKKKGSPVYSMTRLLIGCMEIIFLKLVATIFGLD